MSVNVLELFAGIGGMGLGLERAGMTVVGQVEIDPFCRRVLERHWPEVPRHDDVCTALAWWHGSQRIRVDVVAGGYPCQGESNAGRRRGVDDERWLWPEMARIVHDLRPRWVIGENVLGHRTRGLRFVLRDLERLGYAARAGIVSAGEMGAPHRRARIFVLAELADADRVSLDHKQGWPSRSGGQGSAVIGADGPVGYVADAERAGREPGQRMGGAGAASIGDGWWAIEPDVCRVAHGIPGRVDRLRCLGNAVVPQVAEYVGRLLLDGSWKH